MNESKENIAQPAAEISSVVEHLFRDEAGKMVATLTGIFGPEHLTLAEDVVQEALARALQTWPFYGVPDKPSAWIMRTARNLALDVVRRQQVFRRKEPEIVHLIDQPGAGPDDTLFTDQEIADDRLRLMFVCCHPAIPGPDQLALTLKTLCGFGVSEISRAFLTTEAAIAKRLTRAKQKIREAQVTFEIPTGDELNTRLDGVLLALYFMFNEGYKASSGETLVREELCREAIRLTALLADHVAGDQPRAHALLAMMLLNAARLPARVDGDGNLLTLQMQDRSAWDQTMIARGLFHLARSAVGGEASPYHLQAGIAACHGTASSDETTDWQRIVTLYDRLLEHDPSPVIALNRAVALAKVQGPAAGTAAVGAIRHRSEINSYYLLYAVLGEFASQQGDFAVAAEHFSHALELATLKSEKVFLTQRNDSCRMQSGATVAA